MIDKLIETTEKSITNILNEGIQTNNLEHLYKLVDIHKDAKEEESMNYGNYGRYGNYNAGGNYGNYNEYNEGYNARGRDSKYRGYGHLDRMYNEYGNYNYGREKYGANDQETDKSFHYMVKALEDFIKVLEEEAETQQQKQELRQVIQNSMR